MSEFDGEFVTKGKRKLTRRAIGASSSRGTQPLTLAQFRRRNSNCVPEEVQGTIRVLLEQAIIYAKALQENAAGWMLLLKCSSSLCVLPERSFTEA